jgi:glycosyltransferase involved in cell wall biosynthesis
LTAKHIFKCKFQTISDSVFNHEYRYYHNSSVKIYNWYGNKRFYPGLEGEKSKFRAELEIPENAFVFVSVGGCSHVKRHDEIIKALHILQFQIPNCIYLHLGTGTTEPEELNLVEKLNLTKHVKFLGNQIDIRRYLIASDVYLMTSKFEGMPITTIEAMACRIPAILYEVPGLRDFNSKSKICNIIPPDYQTLASEILKSYNSKTETQLLASKAELMMKELYNLETNSKAIVDLYKADI